MMIPIGTNATAITDPSAAFPVTLVTIHQMPDRERGEDRLDDEQGAGSGGDALAALEVSEHGEHVADDGSGGTPVGGRPAVDARPSPAASAPLPASRR